MSVAPPVQIEVPVLFAEEMPPPKLDGAPHTLMCQCHKMGMVRVKWDAYERVLVLLCAESGRPVLGVKVEKKNRLALDPQRPAGYQSILGADGQPVTPPAEGP